MQGVRLTLQLNNNVVMACQPEIHYPNVAAILYNQDAQTVQKRLSLIYRQCGQAHNSAFFHTQGYTASSEQQKAQNQALALEQIQEISWQLWRVYQLLFVEHAPKQSLFVESRQQLMDLKALLAFDLWQSQSLAKPISAQLPSNFYQDWQQNIYAPIQAFLTQQNWSHYLRTENETLIQYESGPSVRLGQVSPTVNDRIEGLWQELKLACAAFEFPSALSSTQRVDGVVNAARGTLEHHVTWQNELVQEYKIMVPTVGVIHSLCDSLKNVALDKIDQYPLALSVWVLSHFPCMDVELVYESVGQSKA